jgi:hypothetical protein
MYLCALLVAASAFVHAALPHKNLSLRHKSKLYLSQNKDRKNYNEVSKGYYVDIFLLRLCPNRFCTRGFAAK